MPLVRVVSQEIQGDFKDTVLIWQRFLELVNRLPSVTVLGALKHDFPNGGFSGLVLLGESHAAIHTWVELDKAWVELATCGDPQALDVFVEQTHSLALSL